MLSRNYILLPLTMLFAGCATSKPNNSDGAPGTELEVRSTNQIYASSFPAELKATFGESPLIQLKMSGQAEGETWSLVVWTDEGSVDEGTIRADISNGPIQRGIANLTLGADPENLLHAEQGSVELEIQDGKITGEVEAEPTSLSATIEGNLNVSCWVATDGSDSEGSLMPDGGMDSPLAEDPDLSSPLCQPFQGVRE